MEPWEPLPRMAQESVSMEVCEACCDGAHHGGGTPGASHGISSSQTSKNHGMGPSSSYNKALALLLPLQTSRMLSPRSTPYPTIPLQMLHRSPRAHRDVPGGAWVQELAAALLGMASLVEDTLYIPSSCLWEWVNHLLAEGQGSELGAAKFLGTQTPKGALVCCIRSLSWQE